MNEHTITVIGRQDMVDRGPLGKKKEWVYRQEEVSVEKLRSALSNFLSNMGEVLKGLPDEMAGYQLESLEISLEVSSKGNVSLMAIGGELGGTGSLVLHLKKRTTDTQ